MTHAKAKQYLKDKGIPMKYIGADIIGDSIIQEYAERYKHWRAGDKVRLRIDEVELESAVGRDDIEDYMVLVGKEWIISEFYNVGSMHLQGFGFGVLMEWFEKIE